MPSVKRAPDEAVRLAQITRDLAQCCVAKESEIFGKFGLSASEGNVLLAAAEGTISPSALAGLLGVVRSRITPLVQSLVEKGFLERLESARDRRAKELKLTPEGRRIAADAVDFRLSFHRTLLDRFPESERRELLQVLAVLHQRMTEVRQGLSTVN
jgi:DNA-binding MarR family transcriptional regulator